MPRWSEALIREVVGRLETFRASCCATTLGATATATRSSFHILVACIISLRTRDEVTHRAADRLFALADSPQALASLPQTSIAEAIFPAGFYRTKAQQLQKIAQILVDCHRSRVPADEEALLDLPGVGRKTANLVLGLGFGIPAICVDTHVHRISNRLTWVKTRTPVSTERQLMALLPKDLWIPINDLLVTFGQRCCHPVSPRCSSCPIAETCPRAGVTRSR
jgi:endonuclease-3